MNTRIKNILKEFEKNQLGPDEPFRFHCTFRVHEDELCQMIRELSGEGGK